MTAHKIINFSKLKLGVWKKNDAVTDVKFVRFFMPGILKNVTSSPCGAEGLTSPYITVLPRSQVAWAGAASVRQTFFFSLSKLNRAELLVTHLCSARVLKRPHLFWITGGAGVAQITAKCMTRKCEREQEGGREKQESRATDRQTDRQAGRRAAGTQRDKIQPTLPLTL